MNALLSYFQNAVKELNNVTWPTKRQMISITIAVVVFVAITAVFLGAFDWLLTLGMTEFIKLNPFN